MTPHEAALALDHVATEFLLRWFRRLDDVIVTEHGAAWAACLPAVPDLDFLNTVHRLHPADAGRVPAMVAGYRAAGVRPWFELMPDADFGRLADALAAEGARQIGWWVVLERELPAPAPVPAPAPLPPGVAVAEVGPDDEDFARVLPAGHDVPEEHLPDAIARTREQARVDGVRRYVATVDGRAAAAAVLFRVDGIAYLANASTLAASRRRGCQGALIRRRLFDAAADGCERACVITAWGSQSHANLARAGFHAAYNKVAWRVGPGTGTPPE